MPPELIEWNRRWGAPWGLPTADGLTLGQRLSAERPQDYGPFAFQANNSTREFEYAWVYHATPLAAGMRVIDLGGSLCGLQFVLAQEGLEVLNVDPGDESTGEQDNELTSTNHARLNQAFGTSVVLHQQFLEEVALPADSVDRVLCVSTLEHIPPAALPSLTAEVRRVLKPGGFLVLTVDLFLDLAPFAAATSNEWGTNIDLRAFVEMSGLELVTGEPAELNGYPEFRPGAIPSMLPELVIGRGHPVLVQTLALRKRS